MKQEPTRKAISPKKRADHYNNPLHQDMRSWDETTYEHAAEEIALRRLLAGKHFAHAVDVGGGYGRLCVLLEAFADKVTLAEPSKRQLDLSRDFLKGHPSIERTIAQADDLRFSDGSIELITMIRVMHHLPDPSAEFTEISRVLTDEGHAIIEIANYNHARNKVKHILRAKKMPTEPVAIRSTSHADSDEAIPLVHHNPETVIKQLAHAGLKVEKMLSVSNLRSKTLKKVMPQNLMLSLEKVLQPTLATSYFGPSIFFLIKKG